MNKKLQVFVSSTYTDLIEERQTVIQAIIDAGHIPIGMELFSKRNEHQLKTIYKLMDKSDAYVFILGGRYGSIERTTNKSYTQLEYEYALYKELPIYIFLLSENFLKDKINASKSYKLIIEQDYVEKYKLIRWSVIRHNAIIVDNHKSIRDLIISALNVYVLLDSFVNIKENTHKKIINSFLQQCYIYHRFSINDTTSAEKLKYYFEIYSSLQIESISNVTAHKCIIDPLGNPISDISKIRIDVSEVNDWMLNELNKNSTDIYKLSSRRFEELIAEIFMRKGYDVELTPATRDGGKDIYVAHKDDFGSFLYLVECKHYDPSHKVGVNVLRDLYGILSKEKATYGIVVTTSDFTKPAQEFQQDIKFQMSLKNFNSIQKWICDVT